MAGLRSIWTEARAFVLASAVTLALFVMLFTFFEAAALYLRYDPHGTGAERQGADREDFVTLAKAGFALIYAAVPVAGAGAGYALARRLQLARPWRITAAVTIAIVGFLVLTFPFAEFENACNIGEGVVLEPSC